MRKIRIHSLMTAAAVLVAVLVCIFTAISSKAEEKPMPECTYDSVKISYGDTLCSIAEEYNTSGYFTDAEYIDEVKRINNIVTDDIHAGCYLTVMMF